MQSFRPNRFQVLPFIIKNLLIINGLFYLAEKMLVNQSWINMEDSFALHYVGSSLFKPWQFITHMFMHDPDNFMHLLGNMFALWMFGSILENAWGPKRFLIFYLVCGLGAAALHMVFLWYDFNNLQQAFIAFKTHLTYDKFLHLYNKYNLATRLPTATELLDYWNANPKDNNIGNVAIDVLNKYVQAQLNEPTLGASGAVFGVLTAFAYLFPNTYLYVYFLVPIKAKWVILIYIAMELFFALRNTAGDNVARWAHLGGALVGFIIVYIWNKTNRKRFY